MMQPSFPPFPLRYYGGKCNVKVLSGGYYGKIGYFCGHIVPYNKGNKIQSIK